jgi:L-lactate permease
MILGGLGGVLLGTLVYLAAPSQATEEDGFGDTSTTSRHVDHVVGVTYMVIGAIVAAIGIPLAGSSTSVTIR